MFFTFRNHFGTLTLIWKFVQRGLLQNINVNAGREKYLNRQRGCLNTPPPLGGKPLGRCRRFYTVDGKPRKILGGPTFGLVVFANKRTLVRRESVGYATCCPPVGWPDEMRSSHSTAFPLSSRPAEWCRSVVSRPSRLRFVGFSLRFVLWLSSTAMLPF